MVPYKDAAFRVFSVFRIGYLQSYWQVESKKQSEGSDAALRAAFPLGDPNLCFTWRLSAEPNSDVTKGTEVDADVAAKYLKMLQFEWQCEGNWGACIRFASKAVLMNPGPRGTRPNSTESDITLPNFISSLQHITNTFACETHQARFGLEASSIETYQMRFGLVASSINAANSAWCASVPTQDIKCTYWNATVSELPEFFFTKTDAKFVQDPENSGAWAGQSMAVTHRLRMKISETFPDFVLMHLIPDQRARWMEDGSELRTSHFQQCTVDQQTWCRNECACTRFGND